MKCTNVSPYSREKVMPNYNFFNATIDVISLKKK